MDVINFNFGLNLHLREELTQGSFRYKNQGSETLSIFKGTLTSVGESEDVVVIKVPLEKVNIVSELKLRFQNGRSLEKKHFILPRQLLIDNENTYLCYEQFDHTFQTFMNNNNNDERVLKKVFIGFLEALSDLHGNGKTHGHITPFNLVIRNEKGYLIGGIGEPFSSEVNAWGPQGSAAVNNIMYDIDSFTDAVKSCIDGHGYHPHLINLLRILRYRGNMDKILYHPYVQSSRNIASLFIYASQVAFDEFKAIEKRHGKEDKKTAKDNFDKVFARIKALNNFRTPKDWRKEIVDTENHPELALVYKKKDLHIFEPSYTETDADLFRFWRNYFVHAEKGSQVTIENHYDNLYSHLHALCPGFDYIVYQMLLDNFFVFL